MNRKQETKVMTGRFQENKTELLEVKNRITEI